MDPETAIEPKIPQENASKDDAQQNVEKSDTFSAEEQMSIVKMIIQDIDADTVVLNEVKVKRAKALQHKHCAKPSEIEGTAKRGWQSDRNLGVGPAIGDAYVSTLSATGWNPDSLHFIATEENGMDNRDNLERFAKVIVGPDHANMAPEVEDYIQNKVDQGFSIFEIYRSVTYDYVDREIPTKYNEDKTKVIKYETKTERIRIERGVVENIDNLEDILIPRWGKDIQKLPHIMRVLHMYGDDILEAGKAKRFLNVDAKLVMKFQAQAGGKELDETEAIRAEHLGLSDVVDEGFRAQPIDIYRWYGWYTRKDGRREKYRFLIEPKTMTFLSGKPLRKITKTGKYPFVGGPFEKVTGKLLGDNIYTLIEDPINAINEVYNQKADFQYVTNCPVGYHKKSDGYTQGVYELEPGVSYPTEGNPNEEIFFPNIQRSMAWAEQDLRILFEVIEKRTGASTYFQTNERNATGTATRDMIVAKNSETRFGKWVNRIQAELADAVTMLMNIYQEHVPDNLETRILGEDGKRIFSKLSIETLRYNGRARMAPDISSGSKAFERQTALWAAEFLSKTVWLDPRINPKGNWLLTVDTMKRQGIGAPERYLPPEPKPELGTGKDIDGVWQRLINGEDLIIEKNWNIPSILTGLYKKKSESYFDLDEEYRPKLDALIFQLEMAYNEFVRKAQEEMIASQIAQRAISMGNAAPPGSPGMPPQGGMNAPIQQTGNAGQPGIAEEAAAGAF